MLSRDGCKCGESSHRLRTVFLGSARLSAAQLLLNFTFSQPFPSTVLTLNAGAACTWQHVERHVESWFRNIRLAGLTYVVGQLSSAATNLACASGNTWIDLSEYL